MSSKKSLKDNILGTVDPSSYSNPDKVKVEEISLFWDINFNLKILSGYVILKCRKLTSHNQVCNEGNNTTKTDLILDTRDLNIKKITNETTGDELNYELGEPSSSFGSYLRIELVSNGEDQEELYRIRISYETSPTSSALQWLSPEQTLGKIEPFMFSQCQSIHCRSILPCQDTPFVKCPYKAKITAPKNLTVLMSAVKTEEVLFDEEKTIWKFCQPIPIPSYLIAIACGRLKGRLLGLKSMVYSEPEIIEECVFEFSETHKMLKSAIQLCGDYVWGRYDLLVLPPSFPYGGMENPCLTFVTPTLLAGDRSLANVIAHEIAHSWTGNLVTNKTFEHFWLNEGFTTFIERKIQGLMFGETHRHFHALLGLGTLRDTILKTLGEDNPYTCLVPNLHNVNPDDAFSPVPYEKGHTFLFYLEQVIDEQDVFDEFLKSYLQKFKFQSINTDDFKNYVYTFFDDKKERLDQIDWNTWFYSPGMPPVIPEYDKTLVVIVDKLVNRWVTWKPSENCPFEEPAFSRSDIEKFSSAQICLMLTKLWEMEPLDIPVLKFMEQVYEFRHAKNSEIRFRWLRLCIRGSWKNRIQDALNFVNEQGRMKFVRPLYRDLHAWDEARPLAVQNFLNNKKYMMYVCAKQVEKDLGLDLC